VTMESAQIDVFDLWDQYVGSQDVPNENIELARTALVIAKTEYPNLALEYQLSRLNALARGVWRRLHDEPDPLAALNTLSQYLFDDIGFKGNQDDYYDPRNSYLNDVMARRLGIPITLALVYIEVGQRAGMQLAGVGMPGHFLVAHPDVPDLYVDPFHGGTLLSTDECRARFHAITSAETPWDPRYLAPVSQRGLIARLMRNLKQIHLNERKKDRALVIQSLLTKLLPENAEDHRDRGLLLYDLADYAGALAELRAYLRLAPMAKDRNFISDLSKRLAHSIRG